ncbi:DNA-binding CsgD family transcriptional regulator [Sphingomonas jinjuensis]|uniref:DNA-binding CsgD family transcriptional regulator n=1 Tax=Sphingomonas jinjuensis TaxID=535907 RepID=A0A840FMV0_9SPHN|nr:helix-turn-helix transcriptional regulator [Sphingomonas jinjuensis]MBB4155248.1 DNA-binding CsgD family transcriptional regulator [Sphingomonas jinjuensis]
MPAESRLIDDIYEASVAVEQWPAVLQRIADGVGAVGATIVTRSPVGVEIVASPRLEDVVAAYLAEGWGADPEHAAPLIADQWPGFRAEVDYRTPAEIAALPVHAEFLDPRGLYAGTGTVIQGTRDHAVHLAVEGFADHGRSCAAIPFLDRLRPHLARAISLSALRPDRSQLVVDSLALAGVAAAVVSAGGRLRSVNDRFGARMGDRMVETLGGLRFADPFLAEQLRIAITGNASRGTVRTVPIHGEAPGDVFAIHILPIVGSVRALCGSDGVLLMIADAHNASIPSADLLRLMFDLTPGEARVARLLASGTPIADAAAALGIGSGTVRTHLKAVFAKTGVARQVDLVRLLGGLGAPAPTIF